MQDKIDLPASMMASAKITDVCFYEIELLPLSGRYQRFDFIKVSAVSSGKIIQPDDRLIELEQSFNQMRPDKSGAPGHQPTRRLQLQASTKLFKG